LRGKVNRQPRGIDEKTYRSRGGDEGSFRHIELEQSGATDASLVAKGSPSTLKLLSANSGPRPLPYLRRLAPLVLARPC